MKSIRTALALSLIAHTLGAVGISRIGERLPGSSNASPMALSVELVDEARGSQPAMEPPSAVSGTTDARPPQGRPRVSVSTTRSRTALRPTTEAAPTDEERNARAEAGQASAERLELSGSKAAAAPSNGVVENNATEEPRRTTPSGTMPPLPESPRTAPSWEGISQVVRQHAVYPTLARRLGVQGQTVVAFRVLAGGMVDQLRIVETSGHRLLDTAALEAVSRSVPLPISGGPTRVVIPVVFSLH